MSNLASPRMQPARAVPPFTLQPVLARGGAVYNSSLYRGLVAYWGLDEPSGNARDVWGNATGVVVSGVGTAPGRLVGTNARDFELGNTQYFVIVDTPALKMGSASFTIAAWIQLESAPVAVMAVLQRGRNADSDSEYNLVYTGSASNRLAFQVSTNGTAFTGVNATSLGAPALATWYLVVAWVDTRHQTQNIQINNGPIDAVALTSPLFVGSSGMGIGANDAGGSPWDGLIQTLAIWKRALTPQERAELYNDARGLPWPWER